MKRLILTILLLLMCSPVWGRDISVLLIGDSTVDSVCFGLWDGSSSTTWTAGDDYCKDGQTNAQKWDVTNTVKSDAGSLLIAAPPMGVSFVNTGWTAISVAGSTIPTWDTARILEITNASPAPAYVMIVSIGCNDITYMIPDVNDTTHIVDVDSKVVYGNSVDRVYQRGIAFFQTIIGQGKGIIYVREYPVASNWTLKWGALDAGCSSMVSGTSLATQPSWNSCCQVLSDRFGKWLVANGQHYWNFGTYITINAAAQTAFEQTYLGCDNEHLNTAGNLLLYNYLYKKLSALTRQK